ncbi:hypothetical protein [Methanolobus sp. WCC5]|uniref:hypothetical protein n=1 Tax=Methanolobus sp. WCC5 TaxID=3125785 RepID=UPI00324F556B
MCSKRGESELFGGWQVKDYAGHIDILLSGPQHGWTVVDGGMLAGEGVWRIPEVRKR